MSHLSSSVKYLVNQWHAVVVVKLENVASDLDQKWFQLSTIPLTKHLQQIINHLSEYLE